MWRPGPGDVALVGGATLTAAAATLLGPYGWLEWAFLSFMLSCLLYVVRLGGDAWQGARSQRRRADELQDTRPDAVARAAVAEERGRLAEEIAACLREALARIAQEAEDAGRAEDPLPSLRRIQELTRTATSDLRRQLGLLRRQEAVRDEVGSGDLEVPALGARMPRRDVALATVATVLAVVESAVYLPIEQPGTWSPWSILLSGLAASTVVGRSAAPAHAAAACGAVFALGTALGAPVTGGLWIVLTVGVLVWSLAAAARRTPVVVVAATALLAGVIGSRWVSDRVNLAITVTVVVVAAAGGLFVGRSARRRKAAEARTRVREAELAAAAQEAVGAERAVFARELHDTVSHAVGLIAMQAGAAEVSLPRDPDGVRKAIEIIRAAATDTLAELGRLGPGAYDGRRTVEDLRALVSRIRATGTDVDLSLVGEPHDPGTVYRIVQEALTNSVRHAPGAPVTVLVASVEGRTVVEVSDEGPGPGEASRRGYGLVGLSERVASAGGALEAGPRSDGAGFRVSAVLPVHEEVTR
jgi:signal transduction histidine kinase